MSKLPELLFTSSSIYQGTRNEKGLLCNIYTPLLNLADEETKKLGDFTTDKLNFDLEHPVDILLLDSYDGAVNMIINDGKNFPKLINSRFSVQDENTFKIPDHAGFKDTNIYDEETFDVDTALKAIPIKIPKITYDGLIDNAGKLSCGEYTFYFKLADADGNETEVIAESGLVMCHIGNINTPSADRMGLEDENSNKAIKFTLLDIDSGFDFIHVFFARNTSALNTTPVTVYNKILFDYPVNKDGICEITITGAENIINIGSGAELYTDYADINSVKTLAINNNILFFGNVDTPEHDWDAIKRFTWKIIPRFSLLPEGSVGTLNYDYKEHSITDDKIDDHGYCYYNTKNVYYRLGYWPDELYRFGIVYIFNDNSLSPVINLLGIDFSTYQFKTADFELTHLDLGVDDATEATDYELIFFTLDNTSANRCPEYLYETESLYFNKAYRTNSRGVFKFPQRTLGSSGSYLDVLNVKGGVMAPRPLYLNLDFSLIGYKYAKKSTYGWNEGDITDWKDVLKKHKIKGYFIVRQKRIPTILGLGVIIGHTDKDRGCIPLIKNDSNKYIILSFLHSDRLIHEYAEDYLIKTDSVNQFDNLAMLCPEAEMNEPAFNEMFNSNDYALFKLGSNSFKYNSDDFTSNISDFNSSLYGINNAYITKVTNVPEFTKCITNGTDFFSTEAGSPAEAYKTIDVEHIWNRTVPQELTVSTSLVRGQFGAYVGLSNPKINDPNDTTCPFKYGEVYNIKLPEYSNKETATDLDFFKRMNSNEPFYAVTHRTSFIEYDGVNTEYNKSIDCFRGDCFPSLFTHRMFRNFIDSELPTNTEIIDPSCWRKNYGVRCTALLLTSTHSNLTSDSEGWFINPNGEDGTNTIIQAIIYLLTGNIGGFIAALCTLGKTLDAINEANKRIYEEAGYANEIVPAFEVYIGGLTFNIFFPFISLAKMLLNDNVYPAVHGWEEPRKKKVNPKEQEVAGAFNLKAIFKSDDDWELRGLTSINRADVNAVGLGLWITFAICSNRNLAFRDIDYSNVTEEAKFNRKRSFYPLYPKDRHNTLRDSNIISAATKNSVPPRAYIQLPKVPYYKQEYFTRINHSNIDSASTITNSFKVMLLNSYKDYTKEYGSITKIESFGNILYVIFKHGIGMLTLVSLDDGSILPNMRILSPKFGSIWKDSIILTPTGIYGVDSVAKLIWVILDDKISIISDMKVGKFLIDDIDMSEFNFRPFIGHINVKSHYNAFKHDIMFTYYRDKLYKFPDGYTAKGGYTIDLDGFVLDSDGNKILIDTTSESTESNYLKATELLPKYKIIYTLPSEYDSSEYKLDEDGYITTLDGERITPLLKGIVSGSEWETFSDLVKNNETLWVKGTNWSLCYSEDLRSFLTFYDWTPVESANIDNIYFSFDKDGVDEVLTVKTYNLLDISLNAYIIQTRLLYPLNLNLGVSLKKSLIDPAFTNTTKIYTIKDVYATVKGVPIVCKGVCKADSNYKSIESGGIGVISAYLKVPELKDDNNILTIKAKFSKGSAISKSITFTDTDWVFVTLFIKNTYSDPISLENVTMHNTYNAEYLTYLLAELLFLGYNDDMSFDTTLSLIKSNLIVSTKNDSGLFKDYYALRTTDNSMKLWKHGLAGVFDNLGKIKPTNWYGKLHEFNFEFIVNLNANILKIFNNLKIISNKAAPYKFEYEVVGESYEWYEYKQVVVWINNKIKEGIFEDLDSGYLYVLLNTYGLIRADYTDFPTLFGKEDTYIIKKLPYLDIKLTDKKGLPDKDKSYTSTDNWSNLTDGQDAYKYNSVETILVEDELLNEFRVHTEQYGNDMKKYGRVRGNMEYLEDLWNIEIRPIYFKWAYLSGTSLVFTQLLEARLRDKYIKIKVRYSGEDLAVILLIATTFDYSYA